jgi:hypothetical protein
LLISAGEIEGYFKGKTTLEITKWFLFLHEYAPSDRALATQKKLAYMGFHCLNHPPYPPDLALSDDHLFPGLKKEMRVFHLSSEAEFIAAADDWMDEKISDFS